MYDILDGLKEKNDLSNRQKLYDYLKKTHDTYQAYEDIVRYLGVDFCLENIKLDELEENCKNDMYKYFVKLIEKDPVKVFTYSINNNAFFMYLFKYFHFFSPLSNHISNDYDLLLSFYNKIIENKLLNDKNTLAVIEGLNENTVKKLLDEDFSHDELLPILKSCSKKLLDDFFHNNIKALSFYSDLKKIKGMDFSTIAVSDDILNKNDYFDLYKEESLVDFRKHLNNIENHDSTGIIDKKAREYISSLIYSYDGETGLFNEYKSFLENKDIFEFKKNNPYLFNKVVAYSDIDTLKKLTSKKLSELIIDYLFKDSFYNVLKNINELVRFSSNTNINNLPDYLKFVYIDKLSNEEKIKLFEEYKNKRLDRKLYDDIRKAKDESYKMISSLIRKKPKSSQFNGEMFKKTGVCVYDYTGEDFYALVRSIKKHSEISNVERECYSLISSKNINVFNERSFIYGFSNFPIDLIMHVYESDAYSSPNALTDYINRIMTPEEIVEQGSYSEIQIKNKRDRKAFFKSLQPTFLLVFDNIEQKHLEEAKRLNIPIRLIHRECYKEDVFSFSGFDEAYTSYLTSSRGEDELSKLRDLGYMFDAKTFEEYESWNKAQK